MEDSKSVPVSIKLDSVVNCRVRETLIAKEFINKEKTSISSLINTLLKDWCNLEENVEIRERRKKLLENINNPTKEFINEKQIDNNSIEEEKEIELLKKLINKYL